MTYTDGYQVCGDWVDLYTSFTIKYSDKSLKEIRDALPPFEIENNVLKKINSKEDIIKIPEGVVEIDYCAGKDLYMDEVVLPSTLKKIGEFAFANCKYLKHIDIPEGVETIESFAFHYSGLETINLSSTIKKIDTYVFSGTPFFEQYKKKEIVILGNGLLYLYKRDDAEIVVPDGVKSICPLAFSQTRDTLSNYTIKKIVLPDSVENICESAFFRLKSLKDININHKMLIHKDAFNESVYEEKFKEFLENTGK